ncbi:MAG: VWA domain-containing protein [Phycisphaeraceae bacterium]|nr:VWA domain-containing protein [Phycisphaeraceae bacterium]
MWLAWIGLAWATGKVENPTMPLPQLITLGALAAVAAGLWFAFGLTDKLTFDRPSLLLLALIALPIFALGAWSLQQLGPARRWASVGLRVFVLLLITVMLAGFRSVQTHDELTVVSLIDTSDSVRKFFTPPLGPDGQPQDYEQWLASYFQQAGGDKRSEDYWSVQTFDGRPTIRLSPSLGEVTIPLGSIDQPYEGSNVQRAIESAMAAKQRGDSALRIVLVSDGNLDGEVMAAVQAAAAAGVQIDVVPLQYKVKGEVMVEAVRANPEARKGQTVKVSVELRSADRVPGQLKLKHNGKWVDLNGAAQGEGLRIEAKEWQTRIDAGEEEIGLYALTKYIDRPISEAGVNTFDAIFEPDDKTGLANTIVSNDTGQAFTLVAGPGKVLVVDGVDGQAGQILPRALAERGIDTILAPVTAMPSRLRDMRNYDAILFNNVAADNVPPKVQKNLTRYVHDLGGGFVMIGGPDSFGAGGWTNTDIDKYILPVHCQIPTQKILPSGALVLVIDRSGSMFGSVGGTSQTQQNVAAEAAILALKSMYPQDKVGVVAFDTQAHWIVDLQYNKDPAGIAKKIRAMQPGGGTDIRVGVDAAYKRLAAEPVGESAIKHMIVISDGHGDFHQNPFQLGGRLGQAGVTISTIGVGDGHNAAGLQALANTGNGNFYPVTNPANLPQVFIKEARAIRKNLIKEKPFDPVVRNVASPIMVGINDVPTLRGFVLTGAKSDPRIFTPIVADEGEPIFAHHQVGLGRAAAFTADATNRWAQDWLGNWASGSNYADFWARTVRQIARPAASTQADLTTTVAGDTMTIRLDAADDVDFNASRGASFGNNLQVTGSVEDPDGNLINVTLEQVGPGIYEARIPARQAGNYIVDLNMRSPDGEARRVIGGSSKAAGGELRNFQSNVALLQQIAEMTGGRVLDPGDPAAANLYNRDVPIESTSTRPLRWQLMPFLLALLLLDVACRRIAWEGQEVAAWAKGRANAIAGITRTRKVESENTMAALKAKREATTEKLNKPAEATPLGGLAAKVKGSTNGEAKTSKPKAKPATSKTRKFVASEEDLTKASDDFSDAVGGAKEGAAAKPIVTAAMRKSDKPQDQGPMTSRLLDAKRRAQERMNEQEE